MKITDIHPCSARIAYANSVMSVTCAEIGVVPFISRKELLLNPFESDSYSDTKKKEDNEKIK